MKGPWWSFSAAAPVDLTAKTVCGHNLNAMQACLQGNMLCRYNYKKDTNRVYQKVVAEIQLAACGSPGVSQVHPTKCVLERPYLKTPDLLLASNSVRGCQGERPVSAQHIEG